MKTEHVDLDGDTIELNDADKRLSIKIKYVTDNDCIEIENVIRNKVNIDKPLCRRRLAVTTIKPEELRMKKSFTEFLARHITVDVVILTIFVLICILNSHYVLFLRLYVEKVEQKKFAAPFSIRKNSEPTFIMMKQCLAAPYSKYENFLQNLWFWLDMSVYSIMPFMVMCFCSIIIMAEFKSVNSNYSRLVATEGHSHNRHNFLRKIKKNRQICLMLFNSNLFFLFIMLQYWICFFIFKDNDAKNELLLELQSFVYIFLYTNNAFEFLIFGITSEKYRQQLYSLFVKGEHR